MKFPFHAGLAAALLLMLAGCDGTSVPGKPEQAESGETLEPAARAVGEPPAAPAAQASGTATPAGQDSMATAPAEASRQSTPVASEPPTAFLQCRACHSIEPGRNGVGPSLAGIMGRPAASLPGFRYSSALQASGIVWSRDKLDEWLAAPSNMVRGTRMVRALRNAEQRREVIDYLETLQ
jgi:cytochrome c